MNQTIKIGSEPSDKGTSALRNRNRNRLVDLISQRGPITRGDLSKITGLTGAAISRITRELIDVGLVHESDPIAVPGRVGRREFNLTINPSGAYVLGVSITANRKSIHLANAVGGTVQSVECNDISTDDPDDFLNTLIERIKALVFDADFNRSRLLGIGVSAAISADDGMRTESDLVNSEQLGWFGVPVRKKLEDAIKLPVKVEHRASAILRGELGNADIDEDLVLVNVAHGIGTSAYLNGHFMTAGDRGFGALSHFSDGTSDIQCDCGRLGCLEVTASGKAVLRSLYGPNQPMTGVAVRLRNAILMADEGKPDAQSAFYQAGTNLGAGVDAVLTLLKPTTILIAGEIGRQNDFHRGLVEALIQRGRNNVEGIIRRSSITSEQAAVSVALQNFLFTGDLKFDALLGV